jgi:hypothetical protein
VYQVARGDAGNTWYFTEYLLDGTTLLSGWIVSDAAGPVAGSCPSAADAISLFGDPYINPLNLSQEPDFTDDFSEVNSDWAILSEGGELSTADGILSFVLQPRESSSIIIENDTAGGLVGDAYISMHMQVPPGFGEQYFIEEIVRGFYTVRVSELGSIAVAAEANPSLSFGGTADGAADIEGGFTLGVHLDGPTISIYVDGEVVLETEDDQRLEGILLRWRVSNRSQTDTLTLLIDDFAYWDLSG